MFSNLNSSSETYRSRDFSIHTPRPKPSSVKRPSLFEELKWELQKRPPPTPHSQHKDPRLISSSPPASSSRNHASMTFQETIPSWVFEYCGVPSPLEIPSSTMTINPQCKETSNSLAPSSESSKRPLQMHTSQQSEGPSFEVSNEVESKSVSEKSKKKPLTMDQMKEQIFNLLTVQFQPLTKKFSLEFFAEEDQLVQTFVHISRMKDTSSFEPGFTKINILNDTKEWETRWVPCQVLAFDPSNFRFQIKYPVDTLKDPQSIPECVVPDGTLQTPMPLLETNPTLNVSSSVSAHADQAPQNVIKWVNRFNLYLVKESKREFNQFHSFALQQKKAYEKRAQLWSRVNAFNSDPNLPSYVVLPEMPSFLFQRFISLFLNLQKSSKSHPATLSFMTHFNEKRLRQSVERHALEYAWHWRFAMKLSLVYPLSPLSPSMPPSYLFTSSSPMEPYRSTSMTSILPSDALIRVPGFWTCLISIREVLSDASNALVFPSSSCTLPFLFDQVMDMIEILDQQIRKRWFKQIRQSISYFCGYQPPSLHTRMKRLVDLVVYEKLDQLQLLYMKKLCAQLQRGVVPKSLNFPNLVDMTIEELLQPHPLHPYITPLLHLTWQLDSHRTKVFTDPSLDQSTRLIEELMTALHIKFINLPQFHDPQTKYCFHSYIADGLSSKVCAKIPEIHSMKPDLSYFLWLFSPTPTGLSLEQLSEWLKELHETKEKFHYYQVPFVGPFFRISIGQLKKELKVQIAIWNTHLIQELNTHFERLTVAMQDLESVTLKSLFRCQPKRDPTDWHLLHTLLKNKDQVLNQLEMWTVELQHWWQLCFDYSISMSDESMNVYWHVMGCARRLNHEYTFSTDLLEYAEKEYLTRLDIHDQCVRESVLEYCKELEQLTKVGEAKQIQEMVFRFQSLRGRAERLIQLFDTTTHIRTQLNFEEHQVEEKYREFHTVFNLYVQVWSLAQTIKDSLQLWRHTVFTELPVELIDTNLNQWQRDVQHWKSQFPSDAPILQLFLFLENDLKEFSEPWAVAAALANPHLQMRQWFQITKKTGLTAHDLEMLTLEQVYAFHLDLVYDLLIEHSSSMSRRASGIYGEKDSDTSKDPQDEDDQQDVYLILTYNLNSLRMEIHGAEQFWSTKKSITIPYSEIERIELHPPEIEKYILREEEMDVMYKKYKELEPHHDTLHGATTPSDSSTPPSTSSFYNSANFVRRGIWHTKTGNQFYLLCLPKDEKEKLEKRLKVAKGEELEISHGQKFKESFHGQDWNLNSFSDLDFDLEQQKDNLIYQIQTFMENAVALVLTESREIPFHKLIFTIPSTEVSPEVCKKKIESCIQLQQLPGTDGKPLETITE